MSAVTIIYTCPHCEAEFEASVSPIIPAQTYGPPENCYPEEGGECEPEGCLRCGREIDRARIADLLTDENRHWQDDL